MDGRAGACARDMRALRSAGQAARCLIVERCGRRQGKIDEVTFLFRPTTISEREYLSSDIFQLNTFSPQCTISPGRQLSPTISEVTFFHRRNFPSGICQTTFFNKFTSATISPADNCHRDNFPEAKRHPCDKFQLTFVKNGPETHVKRPQVAVEPHQHNYYRTC